MARLHAVISIILCAFPTVAALQQGAFSDEGEWLIKKWGVDHHPSSPVGARLADALLVYLSRRVASRRCIRSVQDYADSDWLQAKPT